MDWINILGFVAGTLGTISFLPQVIKIWRTKKTRDISLPAYFVLSIGVFLWIVYGLLTEQQSIILSNSTVFILVVSILFLKFKYG